MMSERLALLKDYCTAFQPYHQTQPAPCTIEEEYELRKAAEEMAKALEAARAFIYGDMGDYGVRPDYEDTKALNIIDSALAAWNALK
jgi:hypothetical protein